MDHIPCPSLVWQNISFFQVNATCMHFQLMLKIMVWNVCCLISLVCAAILEEKSSQFSDLSYTLKMEAAGSVASVLAHEAKYMYHTSISRPVGIVSVLTMGFTCVNS